MGQASIYVLAFRILLLFSSRIPRFSRSDRWIGAFATSKMIGTLSVMIWKWMNGTESSCWWSSRNTTRPWPIRWASAFRGWMSEQRKGLRYRFVDTLITSRSYCGLKRSFGAWWRKCSIIFVTEGIRWDRRSCSLRLALKGRNEELISRIEAFCSATVDGMYGEIGVLSNTSRRQSVLLFIGSILLVLAGFLRRCSN